MRPIGLGCAVEFYDENHLSVNHSKSLLEFPLLSSPQAPHENSTSRASEVNDVGDQTPPKTNESTPIESCIPQYILNTASTTGTLTTVGIPSTTSHTGNEVTETSAPRNSNQGLRVVLGKGNGGTGGEEWGITLTKHTLKTKGKSTQDDDRTPMDTNCSGCKNIEL